VIFLPLPRRNRTVVLVQAFVLLPSSDQYIEELAVWFFAVFVHSLKNSLSSGLRVQICIIASKVGLQPLDWQALALTSNIKFSRSRRIRVKKTYPWAESNERKPFIFVGLGVLNRQHVQGSLGDFVCRHREKLESGCHAEWSQCRRARYNVNSSNISRKGAMCSSLTCCTLSWGPLCAIVGGTRGSQCECLWRWYEM